MSDLTIEQMRKIVDGAPDKTASHYVADTDTYFSEEFHTYFCHSLEDWETSDFHCVGDLEQNYEAVFSLADLKAQIDQHYYGQSEEKELEQYAQLSQEKIEGGAALVGNFKDFNAWLGTQGMNAIAHANCCRKAFEAGQQSKEAAIKEMDEVIKIQDADLRKYEKQIESLREQLNNMETCYIEKKKEVEGLQKTNISLEAGLRKNSKNKQKLLGKNIELQKRIDGAVAMLTGVCGKVFIGDVVDTLRGAND